MGRNTRRRQARRKRRRVLPHRAFDMRRLFQLVLGAAAGLVVAAAVATWAFAARDALRDAFLYVPASTIPDEVRQGVAALGELIAPSDRVAYVSHKPGMLWPCGLWQRAAYPRTVFCLDTAQPDWTNELEILTRRYNLQYLIAEGPLPGSMPVAGRRVLVGKLDLIELAP
jgi:hypothetical protein